MDLDTRNGGADPSASFDSTSKTADRLSAAKADELPRGMLPAIAAGLISIGVFFGMGGPLWPDVLDSYQVSKTQFGLLSGLSLALSFPVLLLGGRLTAMFGKATVLVVSVFLLALASVGFAVATGGAIIFAALLAVRGLGIALVDLSANTLTIDAEKITGRHLMGPLHGAFSGGSILGAGAVAIALGVGLGFQSVYAILGLALVVLAIGMTPVRTVDRIAGPARSIANQRFGVAFRLPTIRICALLTGLAFAGEIIVADWTAIYLRDDRDLSGVFAAGCIVAFGVAMLAGRLLNGPLIRRLGVRHAISLQGLVAAAGGLLIVTETAAAMAVAGCALAGFGLAGIGPTALSVAGISLPDDPGSAAGLTLAGGYIGLAGAPVLSGVIADGVSPRVTMLMVAVVGAAVFVAARAIPPLVRHGS